MVQFFSYTHRFKHWQEGSVLVSSGQYIFFHMFAVVTALYMAFFKQWFSPCHSSIKTRFVVCITNGCPVNRFSHLSSGPPQLLQSYHGPLGCFYDKCSPCLACQCR
ncbi:hypothetical protein ILYODFUR_037725 [Ilyodon furcidens]|uniref:Uncharacterized protein n=1 Tax=Ilyodon furcidens TaxID=33524 RepID=A0ABV0TSS3_9TELE